MVSIAYTMRSYHPRVGFRFHRAHRTLACVTPPIVPLLCRQWPLPPPPGPSVTLGLSFATYLRFSSVWRRSHLSCPVTLIALDWCSSSATPGLFSAHRRRYSSPFPGALSRTGPALSPALVGNHMPAKGIQQTCDNPKKFRVTTISAIYLPPVSIPLFPCPSPHQTHHHHHHHHHYHHQSHHSPHNHTTAAGIAALAANASFARNLTLPENAAFTRRQRLRWRRRHRHRHHLRQILPPTTPPTPPPTASAEIATITINPAGVANAAVSTKSEYSWGGRSVTEAGARGGVTGGGGGRREGASAE